MTQTSCVNWPLTIKMLHQYFVLTKSFIFSIYNLWPIENKDNNGINKIPITMSVSVNDVRTVFPSGNNNNTNSNSTSSYQSTSVSKSIFILHTSLLCVQ